MPVGDQVAVPAQYGLRADQQPDAAQFVAGEPVQQCGEQRPVGRGEPDLLAVQVPFEDGDLVPEREDFGVLVRSLIASSRSSARALVTPRYASRNSTAGHPCAVIAVDPRCYRVPTARHRGGCHPGDQPCRDQDGSGFRHPQGRW